MKDYGTNRRISNMYDLVYIEDIVSSLFYICCPTSWMSLDWTSANISPGSIEARHLVSSEAGFALLLCPWRGFVRVASHGEG